MHPFGLIFIAIGLFAVLAAFSDWRFFWENRRARFLVVIITKTGARIFYTLVGGVLLILGVLTLFGVIDMNRSYAVGPEFEKRETKFERTDANFASRLSNLVFFRQARSDPPSTA
jgi:hypothetical protein